VKFGRALENIPSASNPIKNLEFDCPHSRINPASRSVVPTSAATGEIGILGIKKRDIGLLGTRAAPDREFIVSFILVIRYSALCVLLCCLVIQELVGLSLVRS
jgi:hypothetical protein